MTTINQHRVSWLLAEPVVLATERAAMELVAPSLIWRVDDPAGGWDGIVPVWPFARPRPKDLDGFLSGERLRVSINYIQAHPMIPPKIFPVGRNPDPNHWTLHQWHLNGDGSLCLVRTVEDWTGGSTAADLVVKSSSWFLEYVLLTRGHVDAMTECGIVTDDSLDRLFIPSQEVRK